MRDKGLEAIREHSMLRQGDNLVVGVSGGADSVALLHFLLGICQEWDMCLLAAHVNHNLRGWESDRDEAFVRELCREWGVALRVISPDIAALASGRRRSVEECAREERYRFFRELAGPAGKIATAHTLSDSAETQLLNLIRGTGLRGLAGIPPVRDNIVRPLIRCTRREIEEYCRINHLAYVQDSTNRSEDYTRNRLRHRILPELEAIQTSYLQAAGRSMDLLRQEEAYLAERAEEFAAGLDRGDGWCSRTDFLALPRVMQGRVIRLLCQRQGIACDFGRAGDLARDIAAAKGGRQLGVRDYLECREDRFRLSKAEEPAQRIDSTLAVSLGDLEKSTIIQVGTSKSVKLLHMNRAEFEYLYKNDRKPLKNSLDCDKLGRIVRFRGRMPGDAIRLAGRGCTKSLKKLFNEARISPAERGNRLVLTGPDDALLWVEGFGAADGFAVTEQTGTILILDVAEEP